MVKPNKEFYIENNNIKEFNTPKEKIVLINTSLPIENHLNKMKLRYGGKYDKIPAFTIDREGVIYQHINPTHTSKILDNDSLDRQAIVIALENVGWVEFEDVLNEYYDWRGVRYCGPVVEIPWRGKKYWAQYSAAQFPSLIELIDYLCKEHSINKRFIGNNVICSIKNYKGVINRSNFSKLHFDLTPAFNFEILTKTINNVYEKVNERV
jgi:hypothetical protein